MRPSFHVFRFTTCRRWRHAAILILVIFTDFIAADRSNNSLWAVAVEADGSGTVEHIPNESSTVNASITSHLHKHATVTSVHHHSGKKASVDGSDSLENDVEFHKVKVRPHGPVHGSEGPEVLHATSALQTNHTLRVREDITINGYMLFAMVACGVLFLFCCCLPCACICMGNFRAQSLRAQLVRDQLDFSVKNDREFVATLSDPIDRISQESSVRIQALSLGKILKSFNVYSGEKSVKEVVFCARGRLPFTFSVGIPQSSQDTDEDPVKTAMQKLEALNSSSSAERFTKQEQILEAALKKDDVDGIKEALSKLEEMGADQSLISRGKAELAKREQDRSQASTMDWLAGKDFDDNTDMPFICVDQEMEVVRVDHWFQTASQVSVFDAGSADQIQIGLITRPANVQTIRFEIRIGADASEDSPPSLIVQGPAWQSACISSCFRSFFCGASRNGVLEILDVSEAEEKRVGFITKKGFDADDEYTPGGCHLSFGTLTDPTCKTMLLATALYINCRIFVQ